MLSKCPKVTVGLPIYNGEKYLAQTLNSLLDQTYSNFRIIISDNGSTDYTENICRKYSEMDSRIEYIRHSVNRGAAWNFNYVCELADGTYFKWAAADDVCASTFLARCVEALEADPTAVVACSNVAEIDERGCRSERYAMPPQIESDKPVIRFGRLAELDHLCEMVFGVIRLDHLRQTALIGPYADSDRVLLCHLSLFGRFVIIPEVLFFNREHPDRSTPKFATPGRRERTLWFDPAASGRKIYPIWRELVELWKCISRSPLRKQERLACYGSVITWVLKYRNSLRWELQYYPKKWLVDRISSDEAVRERLMMKRVFR